MKAIGPPYNSLPPGERSGVIFEEEEALDLRHYWTAISRRRWPLLIFFSLILLFTALSIPWGAPPLYTAKTTLHIQNQTRDVIDAPEMFSPGLKYYETQLTLLKSRSLVAQVIKDLRLEDNPQFTQTADSVLSFIAGHLRQVLAAAVNWTIASGELSDQQRKQIRFELGVHPAMIDRYLESLNVSEIPESQLVEIQFSSSDPLLSKTVADAHAAGFIHRSLLTRFELTAEVRQFLEKKLGELRINLENSEKALNDFQRTHKIVSLDKGENLRLERLKTLNSDLTQARSKRIDLESLYRTVQQRDNRILSQIIDNPAIRQLRDQITALELQFGNLATTYKPTHPRMIAVQEEIDLARKRLDREVARIIQTIEKDYVAARAKEAALAEETERAKREALDLQEKSVEFAILERELASNRTLYETVLKKIKESSVVGEGPTPNLRVVDRAEIPVSPARDKRRRDLLFGIAIGLFGGIGLVFLLNLLDNTLKTPEDVERFVRLPALGVVPDIGKLVNKRAYGLEYIYKIAPPEGQGQTKEKNNQLLVAHHPLSVVSDAYQVIRTAILFSRVDKPPQTILITSSQPHEGKTITAINIAVILARSGMPVLLIDADLRAGHCHRLLGVQNGTGLTNILTGDEDISRFIKKTGVNNLNLLCRGGLPPNPAELLGSEKMQRTLDALAHDYSFIIIDSCPLLPVSDTVLLSTRVHSVILVARAREVSRRIVCKARERLEYVRANILGVVLNGIDLRDPDYGEYRRIYKSHYAHYAKTSAEELWDVTPTSAERAANTMPGGSGETVPAAFFGHMVVKVTEFAGPMASMIVHDQIAALGESLEAFPQSRLDQLIEAVSREIAHEGLRVSFREQLSAEIRKFHNQKATVPPADQSSA